MNKFLFCQDCRHGFVFNEQEQEFFRQRNWQDPIRCVECRKRHKENLKDPYYGLASAMSRDFTRKKRHSRVPYAPYVVGGFR